MTEIFTAIATVLWFASLLGSGYTLCQCFRMARAKNDGEVSTYRSSAIFGLYVVLTFTGLSLLSRGVVFLLEWGTNS